MADDEIFEEVKYIQEADLETHLLSPLIRCTQIDIKRKVSVEINLLLLSVLLKIIQD